MRVVGGRAGGRRLVAPRGAGVRPTAEKVREALFDILGDRVVGGRFLDLYAGTGAVGLEALSRGAASATFVESGRASLRALRENLRRVAGPGRARVLGQPAARALRGLGQAGEIFDIVFLDPPYAGEEAEVALRTLAGGDLVAPGGLVIVEAFHKRALPETQGPLVRRRTVRHGDAVLHIYERGEG